MLRKGRFNKVSVQEVTKFSSHFFKLCIFAKMLNRIKKINLVAAYFMLLIIGIINSKEIMHSFVWHDAIGCAAHYDEHGHVTHHEDVSETGDYCAFCHIDFSIFANPNNQVLTTNSFVHHTLTVATPTSPHIPATTGALLLRGPPALA